MKNRPAQRTILHMDMDAFYAAVEELDHPEYRGRPVVVGADPKEGRGRGVVSTANYEARKFGIHSALPISQAYRRCPNAIFVFPRMDRYVEISARIMNILGRYSPLVEPLSLDEAFLDCSRMESLFGDGRAIALRIKEAIREETGLTASVGVASNKFVAKVASDLEKPDGLTIVPAGEERAFLAPLAIERLWGVGKKSAKRFHEMGIRTIGNLADMEKSGVEGLFGKGGLQLWLLSRGMDDRPVSPDSKRKSISEERTFMEDLADDAAIEEAIFRIADDLSRRMRSLALRGRTVVLKIRLEGFETHTRRKSRTVPTDATHEIRDAALGLYRHFDRKGKRVRLIGVGMANLYEKGEFRDAGPDNAGVNINSHESLHPRQLDLFEMVQGTERSPGDENSLSEGDAVPPVQTGSPKDQGKAATVPDPGRRAAADRVLDQLRDRFGEHVTRAAFLKKEAGKSGKKTVE